MNRKNKVKTFWSSLESSVTSMTLRFHETSQLEQTEILNHLPHFEGQHVLELAAGVGRYTGHLAAKAHHVTANDLIEKFIQKNKSINSSHSNIHYVVGDALSLVFQKNSFDFIFINWLMMYLSDKEVKILASLLFAWLKPGGKLFFRESCCIPEMRLNDHYYANYRNFRFYTQIFSQYFTLHIHDNLKYAELHFADPFQCFWLYQKLYSLGSDNKTQENVF